MTTSRRRRRRALATVLVLCAHMILQCRGKTAGQRSRKLNDQYQDNKEDPTTEIPGTTTGFPDILQDYDILQDAESLQKAMSVVAYESQKLDPKKSENKNSEATEISGTNSQFPQTITQIPFDKKYYEVPRKQSRGRVHSKLEKEYGKNGASNLAEEASSLRHAYEEAPQNIREYPTQSTSSIIFPSTSFLSRSSQEVISPSQPLPLYPPLTEHISTTNIARNQDNYPTTSKSRDTKTDQQNREISRPDTGRPAVKKKRRRVENGQPREENYQERPRQGSLLISKDRIPRPFSIKTSSGSTIGSIQKNLPYPFQTTSTWTNTLITPPAQESNYSTSFQRPSIPRSTNSVSDAIAYSSVPLNQRIHLPKSQKEVEPYKIPANGEQINNYDTSFLRRHSARQKRPNARTENSKIDRTTKSTLPKEAIQIDYTIARRSQQAVSQTSPSKRRQAVVSSTLLPTPKESKVYSTVPIRQYQMPNYQTVPSRPTTARYFSATEKIQTYPTTSAEQITTYSNISPRRKIQNNNYQYDKSLVASQEQNVGSPTIVQPIYDSENSDSNVFDDKEQSAQTTEETNETTEYTNDENYNDDNDSNENMKEKHQNEDGKNHYSYSYIERKEEPIDDIPRTQKHTYEVQEENTDYPKQTTYNKKTYPVLQRGGYKNVDPDYYQDQVKYVDPRKTSADSDYDQDQKQNVQLNVAQVYGGEIDGKDDVVAEADHQHQKKHHKPKKEHHEGEQGGDDEHDEGEHHDHGSKSEKGYKGFHEHEDGEKGHHDKEGHDHEYDEKEGKDKKHHEEKGYHKEHEKGEEGEKKMGFSEKGDHKKGHSTKGEHVIHKKDEFEKKTEFFDEFHEGGDLEKDGGHHQEHHHKKGGHHKGGHHHEGHHEEKHGEEGKHEKGHHHHEKKGHDEHEGHDEHHHHEERHGKKGGHEDTKHWHHKKGKRR